MSDARARADFLDAMRDCGEQNIALVLQDLEIAAEGGDKPIDPTVRIYCEAAAEQVYKREVEPYIEKNHDLDGENRRLRTCLIGVRTHLRELEWRDLPDARLALARIDKVLGVTDE